MAASGYLRRSWNALTSDEGWWKSVCILSLISLIPIVGPIAVSGYCFRWAREAAWGIEEPLPRGKDDLGAAIKSGWFVFLPTFVWASVISIAFVLLCLIPYVGGFLGVVLLLASIVAMVVVYVMVLRGVIYDKMGPGFQIGQAWKMCRDEPEGLVRFFGVSIVCSSVNLFFVLIEYLLVFCLVMLLSMRSVVSSTVANSYTYGGGYSSYGVSTTDLSAALPACVFGIIVVGLIALFVQTTSTALVTRSLGYWMAQFEPARWGSSSAGVPQGVGPQGVAERARRKYERAQQAAQAALKAQQQLQAQQQQYTQQMTGQGTPGSGPAVSMPVEGATVPMPSTDAASQVPADGATAPMRSADAASQAPAEVMATPMPPADPGLQASMDDATVPMPSAEITVQMEDADSRQEHDGDSAQTPDDADSDESPAPDGGSLQ